MKKIFALAFLSFIISANSAAQENTLPQNFLFEDSDIVDKLCTSFITERIKYDHKSELDYVIDDEAKFFVILDHLEDPHNLGAIIRTANLVGAHGVIIPKHRAAGLTATVAKTSAGALNFTPVAKVTNLTAVMKELKEQGMWFVCADMEGTAMYDLDLTGPIGLVIGSEGDGVSQLVRKNCDMTASIPMKGDIDSLNASVAAGVLAYEIVRQRMN